MDEMAVTQLLFRSSYFFILKKLETKNLLYNQYSKKLMSLSSAMQI
jgi:hypothetical protein